jgi:hypothetical protein
MAEACASSRIATEIIPTGVVGHQHDDVGFLVLRLQGSGCADEHSRSCQNGQTVAEYFLFHLVQFLGLLAPEDAYFVREDWLLTGRVTWLSGRIERSKPAKRDNSIKKLPGRESKTKIILNVKPAC